MKLISKKTGAILRTQVLTGLSNSSDTKNKVYLSLTGDSEVASSFIQAMKHVIIELEKSNDFKRAFKLHA